MNLILPQSTLDLLNRVPVTSRHPGLQLDKLSIPGDQTVQKRALDDVIRANDAITTSNSEFQKFRQRWLSSIQPSGAPSGTLLRCTTTGPLTLHLARASALENAGICLHPLYGFVYLPGSGLKGMARAFAETVWLPAQADARAARRKIEDVFGWAPNRDWKQQIRDRHPLAEKRFVVEDDPRSPEIESHVGDVIFHDAWPETWPRLIVDIVNNHHPDYYQHDDNQHPPGDWENPVPVYFLAAAPGATFTFPLAKRRSDVPDELLTLASEWLLGALCHLGAGAKTNAGYGAFQPADDVPQAIVATVASTWKKATNPSQHRAEFSTTLELVTPAFLAGANQHAEDCDLRPATLRGHLRWWWRTMHAGFLNVQTLRPLEAAIWGNTKSGGAVRITLSRPANTPRPQPKLFDRKGIVSANKLPDPPNKKTTQGLVYSTYGMDEVKVGRTSRRPYLEPGATWTVTFTIRPGKYVVQEKDDEKRKPEISKPLSINQLKQEALAALELLCRLGGVGSKSRKGFGCFKLPAEFSQATLTDRRTQLLEQSKQLRKDLELEAGKSESPALDQLLVEEAVATPWKNYWVALDRVGDAAQAFAQSMKHNLAKKALGLPRNVRAPYTGSFQPHKDVKDRHASPIHYHLALGIDGKYVAQMIAFPANRLPTLNKSQDFLTNALKQIRQQLMERIQNFAHFGQTSAVGSRNQSPAIPVSTGPKLPSVGERVPCRLSVEKTAKGGWKATYTNLTGPIQNSPDVPADKQPGEEVTLIVRISRPTEIAFRWPTPSDEKSATLPKRK